MTSAPTPPIPSRPATKPARQARIVTILSREQVHSQEQLAGLLSQYANMHVTQATLSRDLDELGVVRLRAADGALVYALPGDPGGPGAPAGASFGYHERARLPQSPPAPSAGGAGQPGTAVPETGTFPGTARPASPPGSHSEAQAGARQDPAPQDTAAHPTAGQAVTDPRTDGRSSAIHDDSAPGGSAQGGSPDDGSSQGRSRPGGPERDISDQGSPGHGPSGQADADADDTPQDVGAQAATLIRTVPDARARLGAASSRLTRYLKELLTSAEASANLVVLRTPAGAAQFLAAAIDHADWPAVLGTVAGDDTVLVIARDPAGGEALADEFRRQAERRR
jgi:arginine repressor